MSIFADLGGNQPQAAQRPDMQQLLAQLKADPAGMMKKAGLSIPAGMNNPQQIINHLLQSGQIGNQRLQAVYQIMRQMPRR